MTTLVKFNPSANANFQFNPTLDGVDYIAVCTWNAYAPRYYISIYDTARTLIMIRPIIGSPDDYDINIIFGYFTTSKMVYRVSSNQFEITP
jgi:hypothetical protein